LSPLIGNITSSKPNHSQGKKESTMKNLLAAIGLVVVCKTAYELYRELTQLRREQAERQQCGA